MSDLLNFDQLPGEQFFIKNLQNNVALVIENEVVKAGRLLLFRRLHYTIQLTFSNDKRQKDTCEVPLPFKTEIYPEDGVMYFDYRLVSTNSKQALKLERPARVPEEPYYFDNILEIKVI
jgi:hypothetical protein